MKKPRAFGVYSKKTAELLGVIRILRGGQEVSLPKNLPAAVRRWFEDLKENGIDTRVACPQTGGPPFAHAEEGDVRF